MTAIRTTTTRTTGVSFVAPGDEAASPSRVSPPAELTLEAVFNAYFDCRRHKRNTLAQLKFESDLERNLIALWHDLKNETYTIGRSTAFVISRPKIREVWAADFRDRIVHHVIYNALRARFERRFIRDSYACIPGRGNHDALQRVAAMARSITRNWTRPAYYLQMDVANFFNSIDKQILLELVLQHVSESWLQRLVTQVIMHDPRPNAIYKSAPALFAQVPHHKSLRHAPQDIGLPIGNITSQFFANIYMNELDHFAKRQLKSRRYGRYVDDFIILHEDAATLNGWAVELDAFMRSQLHMRLHPAKTCLNCVHHGIHFVGFVIKPGRTYLRRSTVAACHRRIAQWEKAGRPLDVTSLENLAQSANSYLGMLRSVNGYHARYRICRRVHSLFLQANESYTSVSPIKCENT